jgi:hypothetical protein
MANHYVSVANKSFTNKTVHIFGNDFNESELQSRGTQNSTLFGECSTVPKL